MDLQALLAVARLQEQAELAAFARIAFADVAQLARLAGDGADASRVNCQSESVSIYFAAVLVVLEQAMKTDPDEGRVLRWFTHKRLRAFSMQTPAEVVAAGGAAVLVDYIKVIDVRYTD